MSCSTNQEVPVNESSHLDTKAFGVTCARHGTRRIPTLFSVDDVVLTTIGDHAADEYVVLDAVVFSIWYNSSFSESVMTAIL